MQATTIGLRIRTQFLALDIILTGQSIDIAKRIPKCACSSNINHRSVWIRYCKRIRPATLHPPASADTQRMYTYRVS